ncbi:TPA: BppU family phage baseplate upper protein [Bacillus anthracis]|nr:BppU family phage baseplate upper protein [Bacillus cereus biovar anthracis]HDR6230978.1 BppU family phage baseplate upper protein [Bacillus cereus biovar anthracis]HDR6240505.1 BppU family phage baseplate upper protein [Bacillus cereus biovar anthracis]HDR6252449.1 BppU family phage baseplate upper protein [Bacillus cereus biovar anthracis]
MTIRRYDINLDLINNAPQPRIEVRLGDMDTTTFQFRITRDGAVWDYSKWEPSFEALLPDGNLIVDDGKEFGNFEKVDPTTGLLNYVPIKEAFSSVGKVATAYIVFTRYASGNQSKIDRVSTRDFKYKILKNAEVCSTGIGSSYVSQIEEFIKNVKENIGDYLKVNLDDLMTASPEATNMFKRGSYTVFGSVTSKDVTNYGTTKSVVKISTSDLYVFSGSGEKTYKIRPVKDLEIANGQAAYVDLDSTEGSDGKFEILTTKVGFTSAIENGKGGFSRDRKLILCANYLGDTGGLVKEENLTKIDVKEEIEKIPSLINRINRAELIPIGGITNLEIVGTGNKRDIVIDTDLVYVFRGAGNQIFKIKPIKGLKIPHLQCLYIDLSEKPDEENFYEPKITEVAFTSALENGKGAFVDDKKVILVANYNGDVGGIVPLRAGSFLPPVNEEDANMLIVNSQGNLVSIHVKGSKSGSNKYIRYNFLYSEKPYVEGDKSSNYKVWRIDSVDEVNRTGEFSFSLVRPLTRSSEFETAIRESSTTDSVGGILHGDQVMEGSPVMLLDGSPVDPTTKGNYKCKKIEFFMNSMLYRDTVTTKGELIPLAYQMRKHEFTSDGVKIHQKLEFKRDTKMIRGYLAMLPISRWEDIANKTGQITDSAMRDSDYLVKDVSDSGFTGEESANAERQGVKKQKVWGKDSGISGEMEIISRNVWLPNENEYISNPDAYNKVYFDFCKEQSISEGDVWEQTHVLRINTSN